MHFFKNFLSILPLLLLQLSSAGQGTATARQGFCILTEDEVGEINYYDKKYKAENNFFYPLSVLDSATAGFTPNGYPSLLLFFKKNETSYRLLNNPQKQLAWFNNDSMLVCARLLSFDSSYSMELAGNFTMQEISRLKDIALVGMGKQVIPAYSEPALESTTKIDPAIARKALFEWELMAKVFLQALQENKYPLLNDYALDSLRRQILINKLTFLSGREKTTYEIDKTLKAVQDEFDELLRDSTINWANIKYENASIKKFEYYPALNIYVGNTILFLSAAVRKLSIRFDECLFFNDRWWMFCEHIRLRE